MLKAFNATGKYFPLLISIIMVFMITGSSLVYAESDGYNSSNGSDTGPYLNENIREDIESDSIYPGMLFHPDINGTESILTPVTSGTDQDAAAIWQDRVAWQSIGPNPADPQIHFSEIFLYNISTGECTSLMSNLSALAIPDLWEDLIVWSTCEDGNFEVYLFNLSENKTLRITNDSINQINPQIWGDHIVWQTGLDSDPETAVYLYTISTGEIKQLDAGSGYAMSPSIWQDRVVWQDGRNGNDYDIYLYNCTSGNETQITTDPAWQTNPSIWKDSVVWEDTRGSFLQIYRYDVVSGNESQVTFGETDHLTPRIYDTNVVYVNQSDIWMTYLPTMEEQMISKDYSDASQTDPDIWGDRIIWTDNRNGDQDIFLFTTGVEMPPLLVDFTQNTTQGEYPLTVAFTDTTSGEAQGWHWNFGDGYHSDVRNPIYTYEVPGSYSVTLTVHNPWQRNGIGKKDLISVDSEPIPQFSVNQTSGPAPLVVQFSDESSGHPIAWRWDFGDGTVSDEQNPIHRYDYAGLYQVSLIVSNMFGNVTLTKQDFISVMDGTYQTCILPSEGIEINYSESYPVLDLNTVLAGNCTFNPESNPGLIFCIPDNESGIAQLVFLSKNGTGFSYRDNATINGPLGQVAASSSDLLLHNFSQSAGNNSRFNFTVSLPDYPEDGVIRLVAWEGSTSEDLKIFNNISLDYGYVRVVSLAYTVQFAAENIPDKETATLTFGVSSDWVDRYGWRWSNSIESEPSGAAVYVDNNFIGYTPTTIESGFEPGNHTLTLKKPGYKDNVSTISVDDKRNHVHIIRIGDDGQGEVLTTTFIGHDPVHNLDLFRAESPHGLSTFGLASLSRSGSLFQMLYLIISRAVVGGGGGGGGGGTMTSGGVVGLAPAATPIPGQTLIATLTPHATITPTEKPAITELTGEPTSLQPPGSGTGPAPSGPSVAPNSSAEGRLFPGIVTEGTTVVVLLRNLSVVAGVIIVTAVFYFRWKKEEE